MYVYIYSDTGNFACFWTDRTRILPCAISCSLLYSLNVLPMGFTSVVLVSIFATGLSNKWLLTMSILAQCVVYLGWPINPLWWCCARWVHRTARPLIFTQTQLQHWGNRVSTWGVESRLCLTHSLSREFFELVPSVTEVKFSYNVDGTKITVTPLGIKLTGLIFF